MAAVHADNQINSAGAAWLAPSLGRMTQLTTLKLWGTLHAIGSSWRCERVLASAGCAWMVCITGGVVALGAVAGGWGLRVASRGTAVLQTTSSETMGQRRLHRVS